MSSDKIIVKGAREHNLKNINFDFPKNQLVVFTGVSGSGKSSMAFDTLFAEGQRRYVESLSSYARQFLGNLKRPDVDLIEGLSPSIAINQKAISHNPRSTVGTTTEIYDYLRLLFARIGHPHCPNCGREVSSQTSKQIVNQILEQAKSYLQTHAQFRFMLLSPVIRNKKGDFHQLFKSLRSQGYRTVRVDKKVLELNTNDFGLVRTNRHHIEALVDKISIDKKSLEFEKSLKDRLIDGVEQSLKLSNGLVIIAQINDAGFDLPKEPKDTIDYLFSENYACPYCNLSLPQIEPRLFSFNSPEGACPDCKGLGSKFQVDRAKVPEWKARFLEAKYFSTESEGVRQDIQEVMIKETCQTCHGSRLNPDALSVTILGKNIYEITKLSVFKLHTWFLSLEQELKNDKETEVVKPIRKELISRVEFLLAVGLDYMTTDREAGTLSSGESQRIRLASQIGTGLTGVLYILDEPTIGLHPRDNDRLIQTLYKLKNLGNTLVVVEHDEDVIKSADYLVDFGLHAGKNGGEIIAQGSLSQIKASKKSLTGKYLSGEIQVESVISQPKNERLDLLEIKDCHKWNLKHVDLKIPINKLVVVTGVSGSGKSTLVHDCLYEAVLHKLYGSISDKVDGIGEIKGEKNFTDILLVDQSPVGKTSRSNPATYTKVFDEIRALMAQTIESQIRGYSQSRFSFNVKGGRCEVCQGQGQIKIEMQFLPDVYVTCDECKGARFKEETLEVEYKGKNIDQILKMTIDEAIDFFGNLKGIAPKLETLKRVGLGYLELGQPSNTLSGGESQRLKISRELVKRGRGNTLYILDEPTTGLHFHDVSRLVKVIRELVDKGNTVVVIEHNLDVIKNADWIIDMGPEGGDNGGDIVFEGTIPEIINCKKSYTGQYLKNSLHGKTYSSG